MVRLLLRRLPVALLLGALGLLATFPRLAAAEEGSPYEEQGAASGSTETTPERGTGGTGGTSAEGATGGAGGSGSRPNRPAKKRRGGINPCMTPDPGWGIYDGWSNVALGQMIAPHKGGISKSGAFDLVIHFHGHEPIRKEFVKTGKGVVLVGIDLGIGSGVYGNAFTAPNTFTNLLDSVERAMAKRTGNEKAHVRKIALSSWSAGYGAVEQILRQPAGNKVDSVVLLDSVHAGYVDEQAKTLKMAQLEPFVEFARRAAQSKAFMFISHSSIIPPGYASTTETANYIVRQIRGKPKKTERQDVLGLDMIQRFDRGDLHVRGFAGDDKPDHCAHLGLMADIVRVHLQPRWKTPKGRR